MGTMELTNKVQELRELRRMAKQGIQGHLCRAVQPVHHGNHFPALLPGLMNES